MRDLTLLCAICCATLSAQIDHLTTTSDGSILYFSTSFRLNGAPPTPSQEILRYRDDTGAFEPCVSPGVFGGGLSQYLVIARIGNPDVTADGSLVAWNEFLGCTGTTPDQCTGLPYVSPIGLVTDSSFATATPIWTGDPAYVELSRNDEYAAILGGKWEVVSLAGGAIAQFSSILFGATQTISDTGGIVVPGNPPTLIPAPITNPNESLPLQFSRPPAQVRLSRDGRHILYESVESGSIAQLFFYDLAANNEQLIATGPFIQNAGTGSQFPYLSFSFYPCFDDTGATFLYVNSPVPGAPPQVFLWNRGDPPPGRQLTTIPEGVAEVILSGSAQIAYATTLSNRLVRIDVASGSIRELSGRVPIVSTFSWQSPPATAPGSLMQANGSGLVDAGGKVTVKVGDMDAFVVNGTSTQVTFQIPWDIPVPDPDCTPLPLSFGSVDNAVFDTNVNSLRICTTAPFFISDGIHQDFHGTVTETDPAGSGEILHFYMIGLGAVSPPAQTGVAATGNPLEYAQPLQCSLEGYNDAGLTEVTPLFAGLAPGLIGTYQLDLQLPPLSSVGAAGTAFLACGPLYNAYSQFYYH